MSETWKERILIRQAADAERLENAENSLLGVTARRVSAGRKKEQRQISGPRLCAAGYLHILRHFYAGFSPGPPRK